MNAPAQLFTPVEEPISLPSLELPIIDQEGYSEEAHQAAIDLLGDLQAYFHRRNFSHQERFGQPDQLSEQVLLKLAQGISDTNKLMAQAQQQNKPVALKASLKIDFN